MRQQQEQQQHRLRTTAGNSQSVKCSSVIADLCSIQCHLYTFAPAQLLSKDWALLGLFEHIKKRSLRAKLCDDARWLKVESHHEDKVGRDDVNSSLHVSRLLFTQAGVPDGWHTSSLRITQ